MTNCEKINELMTQYIDEMLEGSELGMFMEHIGNCDECCNELEELKQTVSLCKDIPDEDLPGDFKERLHEKLVLAKAEHDNRRNVIFLRKKYITICSSIVAVLLLVVFLRGFFLSGYFSPATDSSGSSKDKSIGGGYPTRGYDNAKQKGSMDGTAGTYDGSAQESAGAPENSTSNSFEPARDSGDSGTVEGVNGYGTAGNKRQGSVPAEAGSTNGKKPEYSAKVVTPKDENNNAMAFTTKSTEDRSAGVTVPTASPEICCTLGAPNYEVQDTELSVAVQDPGAEYEKIKATAEKMGGQMLGNQSLTDRFEGNGAKDDEASGADEMKLVVTIPKSMYAQFTDSLKSTYGEGAVKMGDTNTVDISYNIKQVEKSLAEIDRKITEIEDSNNQQKEKLDGLKQERENKQKELDGLKIDAGNITVSIIIGKKT